MGQANTGMCPVETLVYRDPCPPTALPSAGTGVREPLQLWAQQPSTPETLPLRNVCHRCVQLLWCWFYNKAFKGSQELVNEKYTPKRLLSEVAYYRISFEYKSITVHFQRSSVVYRLCVAEVKVPRVQARGGLHSSQGHQSTFFFGQDRVCRVTCFDQECKEKIGSLFGRSVFAIPGEFCVTAVKAIDSYSL
jgi:hypothetical protein